MLAEALTINSITAMGEENTFHFPVAGGSKHRTYANEGHSSELFAPDNHQQGGLGFSHDFSQGDAYRRLLRDHGRDQCRSKDVHKIEQIQQEYQEKRSARRALEGKVLSDFFWTHIFNNADATPEEIEELLPWIGGRLDYAIDLEKERMVSEGWDADRQNEHMEKYLGEMTAEKYIEKATEEDKASLVAIFKKNENAFQYLWARARFCRVDDRRAWWFTFWDDFWASNCAMTVLQGKGSDLGPSDPGSIMYNPIPEPELKEKLKSLGLWSEDGSKQYFYPELTAKMYQSMDISKGSFSKLLTMKAKECMAKGEPPPPDAREEDANGMIPKDLAGSPIPPPPPSFINRINAPPPPPPPPNWWGDEGQPYQRPAWQPPPPPSAAYQPPPPPPGPPPPPPSDEVVLDMTGVQRQPQTPPPPTPPPPPEMADNGRTSPAQEGQVPGDIPA